MQSRSRYVLFAILASLCGIVLFAGAALAQDLVVLKKKRCCVPAVRVPPPAGLCITGCVEPPLFCDPVVLPGGWMNGGCQIKQNSKCAETKNGRNQPRFSCTVRPCVQQSGEPGQECLWLYVDDNGPLQANVQSCLGTLCN